MIRPNAIAAQIQAFPLADMRAPEGKRVIRLAQNEAAFPPSPRAIEAARAAMADPTAYPDPGWRALRTAIGDVYGVDPDLILCSAGSMDVIGALIMAFAGPGDQVLSTAHGYGYFQSSAIRAGAEYHAVPEPDLTVSVDLLLGAVTPKTRIVSVANPGNPTGTRIARTDLLRLRNGLPDDVILLIDEAYAEFTDHLGQQMFDLTDRGNTVITRSFSKAYALAGQRIGWGLFPADIGTHARKLLTPGSVTHASLAAAEAAVRDREYLNWLVIETSAIRDVFLRGLETIGLPGVPSHTNFVLVPFANADQARAAQSALHGEAIIVRPMGAYALPHCLRITIGCESDMNFTIETLRKWKETWT